MLRAHQGGDRGALVGLSTLFAARLLSYGQHEEAIAHLDFALGCADSSDERAHVLAIRSGALLAEGNVPAADAAILEARALEDVSDDGRLELDVYAATLDCAALREVDCQALVGLALRTQAEGHEAWCSGLLRWLIPAMFAAGRDRQVMPIVQLLDVHAATTRHPWRMSDVALFRLGYAVPRGEPAPALEAHAPEHAARGAMLRLYQAAHGTDADELEPAVADLNAGSAGLTPDLRSTLQGFSLFADAVHGLPLGIVQPPPRATLVNLAGALATAEAVALAGPRAAVELWSRWLDRHVPQHVETALEWPVPVGYVKALLHLRQGSPAEAAAASTQAHASAVARGHLLCVPCCQSLDVRGQEALAEAGDGATLHASRIAARFSGTSTPIVSLSHRELAVLRLFAEGFRPAAVAVHLGISVHTVRVHARNAFRKLDAHSRAAAVERAVELDLL